MAIYDIDGNEIAAATEENSGWTLAQINLLDSLLTHIKYTDADGGEYADTLIASLKGNTI